MSDIERRSDRLATLRDRVERLPGYEGELGTHIEAASPERLLQRSPRTAACRIDAVNMATVYPETTDGCGSVGCLAALAILDCPEEAATCPLAHREGPEPAGTRDQHARRRRPDPRARPREPRRPILRRGIEWFDDLGAMPEQAILDALDRTMAGTVGAYIWKPPAAARQDR